MNSRQGNPSPDKGMHRVFLILSLVITVLVMSTLNAMIDLFLHPEIPFLDDGHLLTGGIATLITISLFGIVLVYIDRLQHAVRVHEEMRAAISASEAKYRDLFESSRDAIFVTDAEGKLLDLNQAGLKLLGYPALEELAATGHGENIFTGAAEVDPWNVLRRDGVLKDSEFSLERRDGSRVTVLANASAVLDSEGKVTGYRGSMRDITGQKQLQEQLVQAQKMESVGRLAGGLAHDFTNYLTAIQGYIDLAVMDVPTGPVQDNLVEARRSTDGAANLTRQLLLFSRTHPMETRPLHLNRVISGMQEMLDHLIGERITVRTDLAPDLPMVSAEPRNLEQAVVNLVLNARAAMPDGGKITIRTGKRTVDAEYAASHAEAYPGDFAFFSVADDGVGMDSETMAHIFEPFFTTSRHGDSSGLGLAVVYGIVTQYGGWVDVSSAPRKGSTFSIYLPVTTPVGGEEAARPVSPAEIAGHNERLLLVEDDDAVREFAEKILAENGYVVFSAIDARQAFNVFVAERANIDLVFSDVVLPGDTGVELAEQLSSFKPGLPVLLASGYNDTVVDWQTVNERGYRFLQKPYSLPDLLSAVQELLVQARARSADN